jgi:hypothetical protein
VFRGQECYIKKCLVFRKRKCMPGNSRPVLIRGGRVLDIDGDLDIPQYRIFSSAMGGSWRSAV